MSEWQPIATAPKDGTWLVLWLHGWSEHRIGHWIESGEASGWYGREWKEVFHDYPTHWMPIPAPPVAP